MIISKTPLRISFLGGGSDFKNFYDEHRAAVLTSTINLYVYVFLKKKFDSKIRFSYSKTEIVNHPNELEHLILKKTLIKFSQLSGLELASIADIPSSGSGLGSSSAFTISLLNSMHGFLGIHSSPEILARMACDIEINDCNQPIGKQDQYACSYGGFNFIEFMPNEKVKVTSLDIDNNQLLKLSENFQLYFTGMTRQANSILTEQNDSLLRDKNKVKLISNMVDLAYKLKNEFQKKNFSNIGGFLHETWMNKIMLNKNISNPVIDDMYKKGLANGAEGGKILGAGGGGFMLFYVKKENHEKLKVALKDFKLIDFKFCSEGTNIFEI